jgi:hypothetical protein
MAQGVAGASGVFRFVRMDARGVQGTGKDGAVDFWDLWTLGPDGCVKPKDPGRIIEDVQSRNKFLKRGLAYMIDRCLTSHGGGPYVPAEISASPTAYVFNALIFVADAPGIAPGYVGDLRVAWNESDGSANTGIPPKKNASPPLHLVGQGRRGVDLDTTADTNYLRRVAASYVTTTPYREGEYVVYAQPNDSATVKSGGSITAVAVANIIAGETFTLNDGIHAARVFEFVKTTPRSYTAGRTMVDLVSKTTADDVRDAIIAAINGLDPDDFLIGASSGGAATVTLQHETGGAIGNTTSSETVADGGFVVTNMTGGSGREGASGGAQENHEIDNLPIKAIGLAADLDCGAGEANSQWGIRSVIGIAPTFQGISDRGYQHEGKQLRKYVGGETVAGVGLDGFIESAALASVSLGSVTTNAGDSISSGLITMVNAVDDLLSAGGFNQRLHFRKSFTITGGTNAGKTFTIKKVVGPTQIRVWETITDDTNGFTAALATTHDGLNAFDGAVANEGACRPSTDHHDEPGTVALGEKYEANVIGTAPDYAWVGRVWPTVRKIRGIRLVIPAGVSKDAVPDYFQIQYLNSALGDEPANHAHWSTFASGDFSSTSQADALFEAGPYGVEYTFPDTLPDTKGVRVYAIRASNATVPPQVGELLIFTDMDPTGTGTPSGTGIELTADTDDRLDLATDGVPNYRSFYLGDLGPTKSTQDICDAINAQVRGYQLEAVRSRFGYLWLRGTVAGDNSYTDIAYPTGKANDKLKLPGAPQQKQGLTQIIRKLPPDALTFIYRINISGDLPQP